jgi:putative peptide maturation dehydrogenase
VAKVRRTPYAFFYLEDDYLLDVAALLRGDAPEPAPEARILALAVLTGECHQLRREELELLMTVPAEHWMDDDGLDLEVTRDLTQKGLILSDAADGRLGLLRERDDALVANEWNLYAALYHYMTQWSGVDIRDDDEGDVELSIRSNAAARALVAQHGPPPGEFASFPPIPALRLPGRERDGSLYRILMARRTTRSFAPDVPMTLEQLDTVLRYVFGCHGYRRPLPDVVCIKRTSPSGGGLHPIEAYPIVNNVEGVDPGIYHYNARDHELVLLSELEPTEGRRMASSFMCGQSYFGTAHVSFVLTARFYRNYWKYRRHQKAYAAILMDAAHLSQTLYLVSAELGLGAFITIAINAGDIEERLGLDGVREGVIAMTGCGQRDPGESPLELHVTSEPSG